MMDIGKARDGMIVAETFRRKRKITMMTRPMVSTKVNFTSFDRRANRDRAVVERVDL